MRQLALSKEFIEAKMEEMRKMLTSAKFSTGDISLKFSPEIKKLTGDEKAQVHFSSAAYYKMKELVDQCSDEIAWDGTVVRDENDPKIFYIEDIFMYPQEVTAATVSTDDEKYQLWIQGLDDDTFNKRRFNGHSHVRMGVTPSGTDMTYREESMRNVKDFFIFGIFNKNDAHNLVIYDVENNILYEDSDITMYIPVPDYTDWAKEEIKNNLTKKSYATTGGRYVNGVYIPYSSTNTPSSTKNDDKKKSGKKEDKPGKTKGTDFDYESYMEDYYRERGYCD